MTKQQKTILVVDDEPDVRLYLSTLLEDSDYEVVSAENGAQALSMVRQKRPDLITLDVTMPEKSGVRFYREIKESEEYKTIPVLMVTGVTSDFERFISTRSQVPPPEGYMAKPIQKEAFLAKVAELIGS